MIPRTSLEITNIQFLNYIGIPYVSVRLTENILKHSIFDATADIRKFLKDNRIHDFSTQEKGKEGKVFVKTQLLTFSRSITSESSLYRSGTRGDTRMWFGSAIFPFTKPDDAYVILGYSKELYLINISQSDIQSFYSSGIKNPVYEIIKDIMSRSE